MSNLFDNDPRTPKSELHAIVSCAYAIVSCQPSAKRLGAAHVRPTYKPSQNGLHAGMDDDGERLHLPRRLRRDFNLHFLMLDVIGVFVNPLMSHFGLRVMKRRQD